MKTHHPMVLVLRVLEGEAWHHASNFHSNSCLTNVTDSWKQLHSSLARPLDPLVDGRPPECRQMFIRLV